MATSTFLGHARWVLACAALAACNNNPWPDEAAASNTLYSAVIESSPRHLDPTASYWSNDTPYTYQIYEPPCGYHYLKRPFQLVPKSARVVVQPRFVGKDGQVKVHRVVCAVDCGQVVNPDTVAAQMESSIAYGLSADDARHVAEGLVAAT